MGIKTMDTAHVRILVHGVAKDEVTRKLKEEGFHLLMKYLDWDYPGVWVVPHPAALGGIQQFHYVAERPAVCQKCGGVEWNMPTIGPSALKKMGKVLGVVVKVRLWRPAKKCATRIN